jgi:hypothetical protein
MSVSLHFFLEFQKKLTQINENNFDEIALELFRFQAQNNAVYNQYLNQLRVNINNIQSIEEIPFLPIRFFKDHEVKTGIWLTQRVYKSSGTTDTTRSAHSLWDETFYLNHSLTIFENSFGPITNYRVLALLPAYDTGHSSLVAMARHFISKSESADSGFFLHNFAELIDLLGAPGNSKPKTILLGVSHALLDLADYGPFAFGDLIVIETGGMKGRKEEITREELHQRIRTGLGATKICSEYGMTELCSQAYSKSNGIFQCASTMKVIAREITDPFSATNSTGTLNIIDLANYHSCGFIETQDLGRVTERGFEVLGRVDNSEARGCNLMIV